MALLGKILAVFNLLAAVGFVYLAAADWGKRQTWAYAVFRYDLAIEGLPVDDEDQDAVENVRKVDLLSPETLKKVFESVGGQPVLTQEKEVQRIHAQLKSEMGGLNGDDAKRDRLRKILLPLARTGSEREALQEKIATDSIDKLMAGDGPFEEAFRKATDKKASLAGKPREPEEKRQAIAHLLFNLGQINLGQSDTSRDQRSVVVLGLRSYIREANLQSDALVQMVQRTQSGLASDAASFEAEHRRLVQQSQLLSLQLENQKSYLTEQVGEKEKHQVLVKARESDIKALKDELEKARLSTEEVLKTQRKEEEVLFNLERNIEERSTKNRSLEIQIRGLEKVGR